jgi:hypothetical protein
MRFDLPARSHARIWRVDSDNAEISMSLSLRLRIGDTQRRAEFELGKLYRYRDPVHIERLGTVGWLRRAEQ